MLRRLIVVGGGLIIEQHLRILLVVSLILIILGLIRSLDSSNTCGVLFGVNEPLFDRKNICVEVVLF
jgi:hypothetical protein